MPRHVVILSFRPCALAHRRCHHPIVLSSRSIATATSLEANIPKKYDTISQDHETRELDRLLRAEDQHRIRAALIQTDAVLNALTAINSSSAAIPTALVNPSPYTYKLPLLHSSLRSFLPQHTAKAVSTLENVRAHLRDLRNEPYRDKKSEDELLGELETEAWFEGMGREEREELARNWAYEEEAMLKRLREKSERLVAFVREEVRGEKPGVVGRVEGLKEGGREDGQVSVKVVKPGEGNEGREENPRGREMSLLDIQRQMKAKLGQKS